LNEYQANQDLSLVNDYLEHWNTSPYRRYGFHHLHQIVRYACSFRSSRVLTLKSAPESAIAKLTSVRDLTSHPAFSALVVLRGNELLHEQYASDFATDQPHSIMSITKTFTHLMVGACIDQDLIDVEKTVADYLPEIGSGYAGARIQDVLDMNIVNEYSEDYADSSTMALTHNAAMGWRLPSPGEADICNRDFLCTIESDDLANSSGLVNYKSANTDVLAWIVERVSKKSLQTLLLEIVEAAGLEHTFYMSTDRAGVPNTNGGACMTARDLARYGLIFARKGRGIANETVGSYQLMEATRQCAGPHFAKPDNYIHYGNQLKTNGQWIGHGGWGGQLLMVNPDNATVVVFFSVLENESASDDAYSKAIIEMAQELINI
jgi:CubicO group peptidase (beta-lactamase class C family)